MTTLPEYMETLIRFEKAQLLALIAILVHIVIRSLVYDIDAFLKRYGKNN